MSIPHFWEPSCIKPKMAPRNHPKLQGKVGFRMTIQPLHPVAITEVFSVPPEDITARKKITFLKEIVIEGIENNMDLQCLGKKI